MKKLLLLITLVVAMSSCSQEQPKNHTSSTIILRGKSLRSGITTALKVDSTLNVYKNGDTVWVNDQTNKIIKDTWDLDNAIGFSKFVIEE